MWRDGSSIMNHTTRIGNQLIKIAAQAERKDLGNANGTAWREQDAIVDTRRHDTNFS
jgi:hypothetical protein